MRSEGTVLGKNVVVESNAVVEAAEVGEGTVVEVGAVLGRACVVGKVGVHVVLAGLGLTWSSTVLYRRRRSSLPMRAYPTSPSYIAAPSSGLTRRCCCARRYWTRSWPCTRSSWLCSRSSYRTMWPNGLCRCPLDMASPVLPETQPPRQYLQHLIFTLPPAELIIFTPFFTEYTGQI
jgi:hypothetical protein